MLCHTFAAVVQFLWVSGKFCLREMRCMFRCIHAWWLGHCSTFVLKSLVAFKICFGSLSIYISNGFFEAFGWIWADNIGLRYLYKMLLSAVTSVNTREPFPLAAIHAHTIRWGGTTFRAWAVLSLLYVLFIVLVQVNLSHLSRLYYFLKKKKSIYFWQTLIWPCCCWGSPVVLNPLYLLWWSHLLIVDFCHRSAGGCAWSG